jgi:TonB-linked SusC/RagA family outer membrane protein|tara:strand:+ start:543 stop:3626 length:3084 start_codon:yes stop_codon:yes gene_type:complete
MRKLLKLARDPHPLFKLDLKMTLNTLLLVATLLTVQTQAIAQNTVTGTVSDINGVTLPGANILEKGTKKGAQTDFDGNFTITLSDANATLIVSYIGFKTKEISVNGQTTLLISLEEDAEALDEIVVVGYGTTAKKDVTGAISSIKGDDFKNLPISGIDKALQGRMAGVQVVRNGGAPGASTSIRIRGTGTVNNSDPLYVVDGIPLVSIDGINPNNIQAIEVLKDASASAIYGTRAANGVVIVTTRKGKSGEKININLDVYTGFTNVTKTVDVLDASTLGELKRERYTNDGIAVNPIWEDSQYLTQRTNWQDELFTTGITQNVDFSMSGGNEKSTYLLALGYYNEEGVIKKSASDRVSLRINSDHKVKDWLKIGQTLSLSSRSSTVFDTNSAQAGLIWSAIRFHPGLPVNNDDGSFSSTQISSEFGDINNPLHTVDISDSDNRTSRLLFNMSPEILLADGLKFKANFALDASINDSRGFQPLIDDQTRSNANNIAYRNYNQSYSFLQEYFLTYDKTFGDHKVGAVSGYTSQSFDFQGFNANARDLISEDQDQRLLSTGTMNGVGEYRAHDGLRSVFGRVNYSYMNKYLLTATVRSDESSKFAEGNRVGVFPAFSLGWRVSDESFFNVPFIDNLKITGGWGELGNQNIDRLQYLARISSGIPYSFGLGGQNTQLGTVLTSFANEAVAWETVRMTNIGLNMGVLDSRLTANLNYFIKDTEDMLLRPPVIGSQGSNPSPFVNIGNVKNKGLEIELNWQDTKGDFSYGIGANASFVDNKVIKLLNVDNPFITSRLYGRPQQELSRTYEGSPIATFYGWRFDGLFQTQAEIDAHATQTGAVPGDVRFKDLDNNGVIDDQDREIIGSPHPEMTYGINANLGYKGFDLNLFFLGAAGVDIYNADRMQGLDSAFPYNLYSESVNRWTGPGTSNTIPRVSTLGTNQNYRTSDFYIEKGDFLRLKNITLGYTLPTDTAGKIGLSRLRLYVTGQNVFTITDYSGMDPELGLSQGNLQQNVDFAQFPQARTFLLGANISL